MTSRFDARRFLFACALATPLVLSACASDTSPQQAPDELSPARPSADGQTAGNAGQDAIARYVLSARPGESARLNLDDGRSVEISVGPRYISATRAECQRITMKIRRDSSRVSAVCRQEDGWHTVLMP